MSKKVFGFAGWSGSGKTTLVERVISRLAGEGVRVSLVKHAHHSFDIDQPGKDSHRHRTAGASEVLVSSRERYALMHELRGARELTLDEALARLSPCDLVLIEGFKRAPIPKLEIWRAAVGKPLLFPTDAHILGLGTDDALPDGVTADRLVRFALNDVAAVAAFVQSHAAAV